MSTATAPQTIEAREWTRDVPAYLWNECGEGYLSRVTSIRSDWWIVTGQNSWCCCPDTDLYICNTTQEHLEVQSMLRFRLAARRKEWNRTSHTF